MLQHTTKDAAQQWQIQRFDFARQKLASTHLPEPILDLPLQCTASVSWLKLGRMHVFWKIGDPHRVWCQPLPLEPVKWRQILSHTWEARLCFSGEAGFYWKRDPSSCWTPASGYSVAFTQLQAASRFLQLLWIRLPPLQITALISSTLSLCRMVWHLLSSCSSHVRV